MTWHYDIADDGSSMAIYEDDPAFTGQVDTLQNDGSGFTIPDDIHAVMRAAWEQEATLGNSPVMSARAGYILMDMVTGDIAEGQP